MVLASCDDSYDTALTKHEAEKWPGVVRFPEAIPEACKAWERLSMDRLVYLSPDSPNVLEEVKDDEAYILGAIIDISVEKYASLKRAESMGIRH
ncbi:Trmt10a, partial [Symbiodinium sp. KB8]